MNAMELAIAAALQARPRKLGSTSSFQIDPIIVADNKQLQKIDAPNWQIIFGRRGAGKTTLLATFAKYLTTRNDVKSASIEINIPDFVAKIESVGRSRISDELIARVYFSDFMRYVSSHLLKVFFKENRDSKFFRLYELSDKKQYIEDLVLKIYDSTVSSEPTDIGGRKKAGSKTKRSEKMSLDLAAKIAAAVKFTAPRMEAGLDASLDRSSEVLLEQATSVDTVLFKVNYARTKALLEDLLDALGLDTLYLFIDEWSELDRSATTGVQPHFADLIKSVFWKNPRFVIKIGAIRNHTRLNLTDERGGIVGLELGADIFEIDLDRLYSGSEFDRTKFFEELIFRHLLYCNNDLARFQTSQEYQFYGTVYRQPVDTFVTYIFKSKEVFSNLINGAGSLPRDFIDLVDSIAGTRKYSVNPTWTMKEVRHAIREHFVNTKQSGIDKDAAAVEMSNRIMRMVRDNGNRLILVNKVGDRDALLTIADLYHRRFLHDVPFQDVPALLRGRFHFYRADLGLQYDVDRKMLEQTTQNEVFPVDGDEDDNKLGKYVLA